jgi:hypothetical protein
MTRTIKKYLLPTLLSSLAALCFFVFFTGRDDTRLTTFRSESGWGYTISTQDRKVVICQPYIPAVEGKRPFVTRKDARRAARIVKARIDTGKDPSVGTDELLKAGVRI